jgi:hypothetical protein
MRFLVTPSSISPWSCCSPFDRMYNSRVGIVFHKSFCLSFGAFNAGQRCVYPSYSGVFAFEFQLDLVEPKGVRGKAEFDIHEFFGCDGRCRNSLCFYRLAALCKCKD